ncbi:MAG: hypothetical protein KDD52_00725 [Bdellovibrionales bacterium]|nr:hypothetical protein [Bdellovibrionales bacterium]
MKFLQVRILFVGFFVFCASPLFAVVKTPSKHIRSQLESWDRVPKKIQYGRVTYFTDVIVYFDIGIFEGVRPGDQAEVYRSKKLLYTCIIEELADHSSTCRSDNGKMGDLVVFKNKIDMVKKVDSSVISNPKLSELYQAVRGTSIQKVVFQQDPKSQKKKSSTKEIFNVVDVEAQVSHHTWKQSGSRSFHQESTSLSIYDTPLGNSKLTSSIDLSTQYWSSTEERRFRPSQDFQLYVWEMSVQYEAENGSFKAEAGRIRSREVPGLSLIDGGLASLDVSRALRVGAYAGTRPDSVSLSLSSKDAEAGIFFDQQLYDKKKISISQQMRASYINSQYFGQNIEIEHFLYSRFSGLNSAFLQTKFNAVGERGSSLDETRLDILLVPVKKGSVNLSGRWIVQQSMDESELQDNPSKRLENTFRYQIHPMIELLLHGGLAYEDAGDQKSRKYLGTEVQSPKLFGAKGGMSVGHQEEWGWVGGHTTFIRAHYQVASNIKLASQLSYTHELQSNSLYDEWGGSIFVTSQLTRHIALQASTFSRFGLDTKGFGAQIGITGQI